jgi:hypothetical protein
MIPPRELKLYSELEDKGMVCVNLTKAADSLLTGNEKEPRMDWVNYVMSQRKP